MATPIDVVVSKCRKICPTGNRRNRALFTSEKFRLPVKSSLQIGSLSAESQPTA